MEPLAAGAGWAVHVGMGVALAACAGLRAFLPLFAVGLAARLDWLPLSRSFEWLETTPALLVFGAAVVAELAADKIPVVDHLLDGVQAFVKPAAGAAVTVSVVADWSPLYVTVTALILGAATAGTVHVTKAQLRWLSTATTGGVGNPIVSVAEDAGAVVGTVAALVAPVLTALLIVVALVALVIFVRRRRRAVPGLPT